MNTLYFSFNNPDNAERFVGAVLDRGAKDSDVSVIAQEGVIRRGDKTMGEIEKTGEQGITTTTAQDAASGAMQGAGIGLGIGVLAGLAALTIPGVGLVLGGGALATAVAGAAGTTGAGAIAGGVTGFLRDQGVEGEVSENFDQDYRANHVIVGVTPDPEHLQMDELWNLANKYHATRTSAPMTAGGGMAVVSDPIMEDPIMERPEPMTTRDRPLT
ncbi:MAG: hypothetical protein KIT11_04160 [Fimbriimonadaceae bacterium]|nr:hypothetical protein [Fimbriimonadaceae bacterium]QYK56911.1 MAG: hypothetical protein KF733_05365 [Fimbriimonadaceae bacterium]